MQYKYYTQSGSVYVHTIDAYGDDWYKADREGVLVPLAGAMHLSRKRLQALITDYPIAALARTTLFGKSVAKEFFDDARREGAVRVPEHEESTIFFLMEVEEGRYTLGHSSRVVHVEVIDREEKPRGVQIRY